MSPARAKVRNSLSPSNRTVSKPREDPPSDRRAEDDIDISLSLSAPPLCFSNDLWRRRRWRERSGRSRSRSGMDGSMGAESPPWRPTPSHSLSSLHASSGEGKRHNFAAPRGGRGRGGAFSRVGRKWNGAKGLKMGTRPCRCSVFFQCWRLFPSECPLPPPLPATDPGAAPVRPSASVRIVLSSFQLKISPTDRPSE